MNQNVENELAVRNLLSRYSDAVWRIDGDAFARTWAEDGHWNILGMPFTGRQTIVDKWHEFMAQIVRNMQIIHGEILDIGTDSGTGRVYVNEIMTGADGVTKVSMGTYDDTYVRIDGSWFFQSRKFTLIYLGAPDYSDPFPEVA